MKKFLTIAFSVAIGFSAFAGGNSKTTVGAGFSLPISNMTMENLSGTPIDFTTVTPSLNIMVNSIFSSGFALRGVLDIGIPISSDIKDNIIDYDKSIEFLIDFGAGYSFINTDMLSLAAFGIVGFSITRYTAEGTYVDSSFINYNLDIGADVVALFNFTHFIGLYASFGVRYKIPIYSAFYLNDTVLYDNFDTSGFECVPAIGVTFNF
ncbi:MAG: transporter [Treponema sp.]|uniref:transporter n=1 Tax=Treponema sp. TaxID=166 RepID=UPI00298E8C69|nr:transporter [Treponema sp.]MCR5386832.1 transporter [Treponema sp.]